MLKKAILIIPALLLVAALITGCSSTQTVTNSVTNSVTVTSQSTATVTTSSTATVTSSATATATVTTNSTATVTNPVTVTTTALPTGSVTLDGAGATFPQPLYSAWFSKYAGLTGVKINYQGVGSGAGITAITNGTVNFGASDGLLTVAQLKAAQDAYGQLLTIPMTADAVPVIINISGINSGQLKLTGEVLANIFLGTVKNWNDPSIVALNPGISLPSGAITVVHRSDSSGTTNIFTNYLDKVSSTWHDQVGTANSVNWPTGLGASGNAGVAASVQQTPNSIGYVGLAYAIENKIPFVQLKNAAGNYISPSVASASAAANGVTLPDDMRVMITNSADPDAYPIVGFTWILVYVNQTDQAKGTALANMLWWAIHDAQADSPSLNYVQLSPIAVAKAEILVKQIKYQGKPIIT